MIYDIIEEVLDEEKNDIGNDDDKGGEEVIVQIITHNAAID